MSIATALLSYEPAEHPFIETLADALCQRGIVPLFDKNDLHHPEMDFVEYVNTAVSEPDTSESTAESLAGTIAQRVYTLLNFKNTNDVNIVIDQRGKGSRREPYKLPERFPDIANYPTLVFRPDIGDRTDNETIVGTQWTTFHQTMEKSLSKALGILQTEMKIHILGNAQLGILYSWGRYFNCLTYVALYCYHSYLGKIFSNEKWRLLQGGKLPYEPIPDEPVLSEYEKQRLRKRFCELREQWELLTGKQSSLEKEEILETRPDEKFRLEHKISQLKEKRNHLEQEMEEIERLLPSESESGEKNEEVALYVGFQNLLNDVKDYVSTTFSGLRLVHILRGRGDFETDDDIMQLLQEVLARLQHLRKQNKTTTVYLYCALPFNVVPLLAANLVNIQVIVNYMEFRKDLKEQAQSCSPSELYEFLPMK